VPEVIAIHPERDIDAFGVIPLAHGTDGNLSKNALGRRCIRGYPQSNVPRKRRILNDFGSCCLRAEFGGPRDVDTEQVIKQSPLVFAKRSSPRSPCHRSPTPEVAAAKLNDAALRVKLDHLYVDAPPVSDEDDSPQEPALRSRRDRRESAGAAANNQSSASATTTPATIPMLVPVPTQGVVPRSVKGHSWNEALLSLFGVDLYNRVTAYCLSMSGSQRARRQLPQND
jgi:hypothetical protein